MIYKFRFSGSIKIRARSEEAARDLWGSEACDRAVLDAVQLNSVLELRPDREELVLVDLGEGDQEPESIVGDCGRKAGR